MTHCISGFIGPTEHLEAQTKGLLKNAEVIPLAQGLAFLPLGSKLYDEIRINFSNGPMMWLADQLKSVPIAWIETDYFGGAGKQSAVLWKDGSKHRFNANYSGNIDMALKELGVICKGDEDEFDALGLGKHRSNDAWLGKEDY